MCAPSSGAGQKFAERGVTIRSLHIKLLYLSTPGNSFLHHVLFRSADKFCHFSSWLLRKLKLNNDLKTQSVEYLAKTSSKSYPSSREDVPMTSSSETSFTLTAVSHLTDEDKGPQTPPSVADHYFSEFTALPKPFMASSVNGPDAPIRASDSQDVVSDDSFVTAHLDESCIDRRGSVRSSDANV